jgi:hypothetical protein
MANIKLTASNFDNKLEDWKNNVSTSRADVLYFLTSEINEIDIQQVAWEKNLLISISSVDNFTSKITFVDILH